jgi:hypothetical protein
MELSEIVRRTVQANAKLYKGWLDLSLEYFRGISEIFGGPQSPFSPPAHGETDSGPGVLVLEGEEGSAVQGAFLVTNDLARKVTCELYATEFADSSGSSISVKARFQPPRLELAPGEQRVVQVVIPIDARFTPGAGYSGELAIKGMEGFAVPVVLRRRHRVEEATQPATRTEPTAGKPSAKPAPRRKAAAKKAPAAESAQGRRIARQKE